MKVKPSAVWKEFSEFYAAALAKSTKWTIIATFVIVIALVDEVINFSRGWGLAYKLVMAVPVIISAIKSLFLQAGGK